MTGSIPGQASFVVNSQQRGPAEQGSFQGPSRTPIPQPPALTEDDKKLLNKQVSERKHVIVEFAHFHTSGYFHIAC